MNDNKEFDFKILYSQAWNQYNIYHQSYSIYNNKFNTIGAVSSIFILVFTTAAEAWSKWFYLPVPFLLFPFFVALRNLKYGKIEIPWFSKKDYENFKNENETNFLKKRIDDIFFAADTLLEYKKWARKWVSISVWFIISSVILSFISLLLSLLPFVCSLYTTLLKIW